MKKKQKAFTLAELLVVVVIIGILAAVVLPKFTKMLEGFKTAEAEHLLEAVRNEQEARCTLGKKYTTTKEELNAWATDSSKHFDYTLQAEGMSASRKGENYSLSIPSYEDGRICCDNCEGLNKNYISCDDLRAKPDYVSGSSCAGNPPPPPCEEQPDDTSRSCGCGGHYVDHFNTTSCQWETGTECIGNDTNHFEGEQRTTQGDGTSTCGTKVEEYACVNGAWALTLVTDFSPCEAPCEQTQEPVVSCGCGGHYEQTWNQATCQWDQSEVCVGETQPESPSASCGCNDTGHYEYTWNQNTCTWETDGVCVGETQPQMPSASCGCNNTGHYEYTWNQNTCTWDTDDVCVGEDSGCEGACKWKRVNRLTTCTLSWEMYCSLSQQSSGAVVNWVPFLQNSANCNIGTYYSSSGVCGETPTSPSDVCMAYESHIVPPACNSEDSPSGNVNWGVARKYVAECSALSRN